MTKSFQLEDGRIEVLYDSQTFELLELHDWNGNDLTSTKWVSIAIEKLEDMKFMGKK